MRLIAAALLLVASLGSSQVVPWTTRGGDNTHSGWNSHETILTQASVRSKGLTLQPPIPLLADPKTGIGDARGVEAQPLVDTGVMINGQKHDIMLLASMANEVEVADFYTNQILYRFNLDRPMDGNKTIDIYGINPEWGCLATGVIDGTTHKAYLPCQYSPSKDGNPLTSRYAMYVVDLSLGKVVDKVPFEGTMTVNGHGSPQDFNLAMRKLRASAVLLNQNGKKTVIECGGSVYMTKPGVTGFCSAFDVATDKFTDYIATTQGRAGNVWMSGGAPAVLPDGSIVFVTATGGFDGVSEFAESVIRMTYDGKLHFVDHFTPYRDRVRTDQDSQSQTTVSLSRHDLGEQGVAGMPVMVAGANPSTGNFGPQDTPVNGHAMAMPTLAGAKVVKLTNPRDNSKVSLYYPSIAAGTWADEDLGSSQEVVIPELNLCLVTGKDGIAYSVNCSNMGNTLPADLTNPKGNCAKLLAPPVFATAWTGQDACPSKDTSLNFLVNEDTVHQHFPAVPMYDPILKSWTVFFWGENQQLKKYRISQTGQLVFVAQSQEFASDNIRFDVGGGMTGGGCGGSSNGDLEHGGDPNSALLICTVPYGDANKQVTDGRMLVYDPIHTQDGVIHKLWDSQDWTITFKFNKFLPPYIDGGEVIYGDYGGRVLTLR